MRKLSLVLLLSPALAMASQNSHRTEQEISHLLSYVQQSGCELKRSRVWQSPDAAVSHLNQRYRVLSEQGKVDSAETFIRSAATVSLVTGQPYLVRCADGNEEPTASWLGDELYRYRNQN